MLTRVSEQRMSVLVAGCGYVGTALAQELARAGHRVIGLRRDTSALPDGVEGLAADLTKPETLRELPSDIDRLVYTAGASGRSEEAYEDAYVRGLSNVVDALARRGAPVRRALFTSSTAVYGQDDGEWIDETSPTVPSRFTGEVLLRGERLLADAFESHGVLRLAGIYGPGRTWLVRTVREGTARAEPGRYGNRIHRDDCAGALHHLLTLDRVPPVLVGVDDDPAPLASVHAFVAELLGVDPPSEAAGADDARGGNKRCSNTALKATGYRLRVPSYRQGYPAIVRAYLEGV